MSGELEDFLRRAAQRRAENAAARAERPQPPRRPEYTQRDRERMMTSGDADDEIVIADLVPAQPVEERLQRRASVGNESAEAIRRKLKAKLEQTAAAQRRAAKGERADNLSAGGLQGGSGQAGQSSLGQIGSGQIGSGQSGFGQGVGMLSHAAREPEPVSGPAGGSPALQAVLRLIRDPHGIDQAILAREILDRPTHRWE